MGERIERGIKWARRLVGSARVVVDKAAQTVEGVKEELHKYGEEEKKPSESDN